MPKMKTHRGAAKRFRITGSGKLRRKKAGHTHLFSKKTSKRLRSLKRKTDVSEADSKKVRRIMGVGVQK